MNQYKEFDSPAKKGLVQTITKIVPAVLTALVATALGFIALYTSPVPMIQDFGKMLTVGMIISFFAGTFILIPLLFTRDHFFPNKKPASRFKKSQVKKLRAVFKWLLLFLILAALSLGLWIYLDQEAVTVIDSVLPQNMQLQDYMDQSDRSSLMMIGFFAGLLASIPLVFIKNRFFANRKSVVQSEKRQAKKLHVVFKWLLLFLILAVLSLGLWIYLDHEAVTVIASVLPQGIQLQDYVDKADEFINTIRTIDLSTLIGVSFFAGLLFSTPLLFARYPSIKPGQFLGRFTKKLIAFRWLIIFLAFAIAGSGIWADLDAGAETDVESFMPQDLQALEDIHKLRDIVGTTDQVSIVYENEHVLSASSLNWVEAMTGKIEKEFPEVVVETNSITEVIKQLNDGEVPTGSDVNEVLGDIPDEQKQQLVNESETKGVITVGIKHLEAEPLENFITDLKLYLQENQPQNMETTVTGKSVLDVEMVSALTTGRYKMTLLGMGLVFLGLLAIYRHPVKAFIPLLPIVLIVGWSGAFMALMGINYTPLTATLGALIIGIGTEFTILIMERFYEERKKGRSKLDAISIANQKIGKAIFASAITTIGGFGALLTSDFVILSNFGMITLINISLALFSTMVVMPAILIILDRFVKVRPAGETDTSTVGETM